MGRKIGLVGHGIASNLVKHCHKLAVLEHPGNKPLLRELQRNSLTR